MGRGQFRPWRRSTSLEYVEYTSVGAPSPERNWPPSRPHNLCRASLQCNADGSALERENRHADAQLAVVDVLGAHRRVVEGGGIPDAREPRWLAGPVARVNDRIERAERRLQAGPSLGLVLIHLDLRLIDHRIAQRLAFVGEIEQHRELNRHRVLSVRGE